jgi:hypothetical protein
MPEGVAEASQIPPPTFCQNYLVMKNTADVPGDTPIAVWLQSISGVSAINPYVAFYDNHGGKREVLFFFSPGHHTRLIIYQLNVQQNK